MDVVWLCVLGLMLGGWFVLDGANLGLGMSLRRIGRSGPERRMLLTGLGPYLLGGEVWLVAAAGLLIGVFPGLEKDLFYAYYPLVVAFVTAWVLRDIGVWFRSRRSTAAWRDRWERVVIAASTVFAFVWGMLLGNVAQGVPEEGMPPLETLVGLYALLWGVAVVAVLAMHGAIFAALRLARERRERAMRTAHRAVGPATALLGAIAIATPAFSIELDQPVPALALHIVAVSSVVIAGRLATRRPGWAYVCSATAVLSLVVAVGVATAPRLLEGIAASGTLDTLQPVVFSVLPVLIAAQAWMWWTFRRPVGNGSAVFF